MKCCAEVQLSGRPLFEHTHTHTFSCQEPTATVSLLLLMVRRGEASSHRTVLKNGSRSEERSEALTGQTAVPSALFKRVRFP